MSLSRRQFFRFWEKSDKPSPERLDRYQVLETYVRTQLLPYDFSLSMDQEVELMEAVRLVLDRAPNADLFSNEIRGEIEEIVDRRLVRWRRLNIIAEQGGRLDEVRAAATDYVTSFLTLQPEATVQQLKERFGLHALPELEAELKKNIGEWIGGMDAEHLMQYDIISIGDLVFAQLRAWC